MPIEKHPELHQAIFTHRGWWQELDEHRDKFAALMPRHGIDPTPENVREVWQSAWVASWPFVELRWVPENHRAEVANRTSKLVEAMCDAGRTIHSLQTCRRQKEDPGRSRGLARDITRPSPVAVGVGIPALGWPWRRR